MSFVMDNCCTCNEGECQTKMSRGYCDFWGYAPFPPWAVGVYSALSAYNMYWYHTTPQQDFRSNNRYLVKTELFEFDDGGWEEWKTYIDGKTGINYRWESTWDFGDLGAGSRGWQVNDFPDDDNTTSWDDGYPTGGPSFYILVGDGYGYPQPYNSGFTYATTVEAVSLTITASGSGHTDTYTVSFSSLWQATDALQAAQDAAESIVLSTPAVLYDIDYADTYESIYNRVVEWGEVIISYWVHYPAFVYHAHDKASPLYRTDPIENHLFLPAVDDPTTPGVDNPSLVYCNGCDNTWRRALWSYARVKKSSGAAFSCWTEAEWLLATATTSSSLPDCGTPDDGNIDIDSGETNCTPDLWAGDTEFNVSPVDMLLYAYGEGIVWLCDPESYPGAPVCCTP